MIKQKFPRDKVCGDFVSPVAQNELSNLGITNLPEFKRSNTISRASVYLDGNKLISRTVPKIQGLPRYGRVVPRIILDKLLLDVSVQRRGYFLGGTQSRKYARQEKRHRVNSRGIHRGKELKARLLIGADGSNSTIAKLVRGHPPSSADRIIAIRGYFEDVEGPANQADLHFNKESFPGYCWLFPNRQKPSQRRSRHGPRHNTYGNRLKELLNHLIKNNPALHKRLSHAKLVGQIGGWPLNNL